MTDTHPHPTDVVCPFCKAASGAVCTVKVSGSTIRRRRRSVHSARLKAHLARLRDKPTPEDND